MKKITILFLLLITTWGSYAQFPEGFEGATFPPTGWTSYRGTNGLGTAQDWSVNTSAANIASGLQSAFVRYETLANTTDISEDWLVTPQFTVTAPNTLLTFFDRQQYTVDYGTTYSIKVSTTSQTDISTFIDVDVKTEADLPFVMTQRGVDLSAYVGQSIYVAFVMTQNDGDNWAVDNVAMQVPASSVPDCATLVSPADNATNVTVGAVTFSWTAPITGEAPTSYDLYGGTTIPLTSADLIGNYTTTSAQLNVGAYNTTFYWMIVPKNLAGDATGCATYTFTTQDVQPYCLYAINGLYPSATYTPSVCDGATSEDITTSGYAGEYSNVAVTAGNTYLFSSSEAGDIVTISADGGQTAATYGTGSASYTATADGVVRFYTHLDDGTCGDESVSRTRSVVCSPAASTNGFNGIAGLSCYPNPTTNIVNITYIKDISNIKIYNVLGQMVQAKLVGSNATQLDLSNLASGTYIAKLTADSKTETFKITKQ